MYFLLPWIHKWGVCVWANYTYSERTFSSGKHDGLQYLIQLECYLPKWSILGDHWHCASSATNNNSNTDISLLLVTSPSKIKTPKKKKKDSK